MPWYQLKLKNNWEHLSYQFNDKQVKFPKKVKIEWPSGLESEVIVETMEYSTAYNDMGHTYTSSGTLECFYIEVQGVRTKFKFHQVKVWFNKIRYYE